MLFTKPALVAAALGASNVAGASLAARHGHLHAKRGDAIITATYNGEVITFANTFGGAAASPTPKAISYAAEDASPTNAGPYPTPSASSGTQSSKVSSSGSSGSGASGSSDSNELTSYKALCSSSCASSKVKRATAEEIAYVGNTGTSCGGWGDNMALVSSSIASKYNTIEICSDASEDWTVACWNKIGSDGCINGWYEKPVLQFTLAEGSSKYLAVADNSQIGCGAVPASESLPKDSKGGWAMTWFEADIKNCANKGWSGSDISSIQAEAAGLPVQGMMCTRDGVTSSIGSKMSTVNNAFTYADKDKDGIGLNIPATTDKINIKLVVGWNGSS